MKNSHNKIANDDYNALVHDYANVKSALDGGNLDSPFYSETLAFITGFAGCLADENGFDLEDFFNDVDDCRVTRGASSYSSKPAIQASDVNDFLPLLNELVRAFKNRAPSLGEQFERVVRQNKRVANSAVVFLIMEYGYLNREASAQQRELKNEKFRITMFETGNDRLYSAALNVIRSYAASMARAVLAADVDAAIGGENNAD